MFPEYRELITKLKTTDRHFSHLFDKHNNLDAKILQDGRSSGAGHSRRD
jgi:uncharacterized protein YdcH (DUF465 family)